MNKANNRKQLNHVTILVKMNYAVKRFPKYLSDESANKVFRVRLISLIALLQGFRKKLWTLFFLKFFCESFFPKEKELFAFLCSRNCCSVFTDVSCFICIYENSNKGTYNVADKRTKSLLQFISHVFTHVMYNKEHVLPHS